MGTAAVGNELEEEPILKEQNQRFCMFPIRYRKLWEIYKKAEGSFWTLEEVDLPLDVQHWEKLNDSERLFISRVLAFFAASDGIVLENLAARFLNDVQMPEARAFYGFQIAMENVHSEMYSLLLETYIKDSRQKNHLFNAIKNVECVAKKAKRAFIWIHSSTSFAERLIAFACVRGNFLLWKRGMIPGLTFSNELISRDKGLHRDFACALLLQKPLKWQKAHQIVREAVEIEIDFVALGYERKYDVENPFEWMEFISLQGKANFLERRVDEYQKASVMSGLQDGGKNYVFKLDEDF